MKVIVKLLLLLLGAFLIYFFFIKKEPVLIPHKISTAPVLYESLFKNAHLSIFEDDMSQVTQIKITPDNQYMLVATLPGTVWVYQKVNGVFLRQIKPFCTVTTSQPGFPPREAGLTGLFFGADFDASGDVFLDYSYAKGKDDFRNRVTRVTFRRENNQVFGRNADTIFEANTRGDASHQIQDGVGVMIEGKPHILFTIGEGFKAERALDPAQEAGKLILLKRDGSIAEGVRPYPASPKVQAIGIRNAPAIVYNRVTGKIMFADTGPDNYDRLIYGKFFDANGQNGKPLSFNWDGKEESLLKSVASPYQNTSDTILFRWVPTQTAVDIVYYANDKLPRLGTNQQYVLVTVFGKTGSKLNEPGKKILLGTLTDGFQDSIELAPFIQRAPAGNGKLSHPLGLAVDTSSKIIYFGDIMEGHIYQIKIE